ncbi:hypothetical protein FA13DRAFT_363332 [Coprinellus micaceus]|uniref:DUF6535 domain-containing protein n=1 Tax=Coprinellus micaceus TaxID=71717 RepID=A0A4Y7TB21_COPMI|nr:hypothetical protein FA13DRAFT_363332 [Coprinellus micaceus]
MPLTAIPARADGLELWDAVHCKPSPGSGPTLEGPHISRKDYRYSAADQEWVECAIAVREHDKTILENWNREMDTQLLFSSLFSGIVAGFILAATDLVRVDEYPSMHAKLTSIAANVLWFGSLIISLNSVLSAILVKQWLLEYVWEHDGASNLSPKLSFAVRHLRFQNLHGSNIPLYIEYLPLQMVHASAVSSSESPSPNSSQQPFSPSMTRSLRISRYKHGYSAASTRRSAETVRLRRAMAG